MRNTGPTRNDLEINLEQASDGTVIHLGGRFNIDSSPLVRDRLLVALAEQSVVFVDLSDVQYIDSSGMATLVEGLKIAIRRRGKLCLKGLQGRPLHFFEATGIITLFETRGCVIASPQTQVS
jgi:anti-sigma B factor antagonist